MNTLFNTRLFRYLFIYILVSTPLAFNFACATQVNSTSSANASEKFIWKNFENWKRVNGNYVLRDGWLFVNSYKENPNVSIKSKITGNMLFSATLRNINKFHWAGIVGKEKYRLIVNNQFGRLEFWRKNDRTWELVEKVANYRLYVRDDQQFEISLRFHGNKIYGYLDGKLLVRYKESSISTSDKLELISGWSSEIAWGNVRCETVKNDIDVSDKNSVNRPKSNLIEVVKTRGLRNDNIYSDAEEVIFKVSLKARRKYLANIYLNFSLYDVYGDKLGQSEVLHKTPFNEISTITTKFSPNKRGVFKLVLSAGEDSKNLKWVEDIGSFAILPKIDTPANKTASYFGGHVDGINANWHLLGAKKIGIQWLRAHDGLQTGWWTRVQPNGIGQWLWPYDNAQNLADKYGFSTLGGILWTPKWAARIDTNSKYQKNSPPKSTEEYSKFVTTLMNRYKKSIKYWEVWNEPDYAYFWSGTPEEYVELLKTAYFAAHNVDEKILIVGGGGVSPKNIEWIERVLQAGGGNYMDVFSIHYLKNSSANNDMANLRNLFSKYNVTVPIWNTEASVPSTSFLQQLITDDDEEMRFHFRNACYELVKMYMENISNGVDRVFYYHQFDPWRFGTHDKPELSNDENINTGMWDQGHALKPIGVAHAVLASLVEGKKFYKRLNIGDMRVFIFESETSAVAVQYAEYLSYKTNSNIAFDVADTADLKYVDFMGNEFKPLPLADSKVSVKLSKEPRYLALQGQFAGELLEKIYSNSVLLKN